MYFIVKEKNLKWWLKISCVNTRNAYYVCELTEEF